MISKFKTSDVIAVTLLVLYTIVFSWLTISQHDGFRTYAFDAGMFDQAIWNTGQGRPFQTTLRVRNVLQGHFSPALALYAPLYWIWPDIRLLLVLVASFIASAGFLIYWYFRGQQPWWGLGGYAAYLMHPAVHQVNLIGFRRETLAILSTSFVLYCLLKRRYGWMVFGLVVALLCKEDMAFAWIGVGLYVTLLHHSPKIGLPILLVGTASLVLIPFVVIPGLSGSVSYRQAQLNFGYLGGTLGEILRSILSQPGLLLKYPLQEVRLVALWRFLWPSLFYFVLAPEIALFLIPYLAYLLMSASDIMGGLGDWYPSIILVFLFWAVARGGSRLPPRWSGLALGLLLLAGLSGWVLYSQVWPGARFAPDRFQVTRHDHQVEKVLQQVPTQVVVAAQDTLVPHLSHREEIYLFPWTPPREQVDYFAFDRQKSLYPLSLEEYRTEFYNFLASPDYEIVHQIDDFYLFRPVDKAPEVARQDTWGNSLTLTEYSMTIATADGSFQKTMPADPSETAARVELYWYVDQAPRKLLSVFVHVLNGQTELLAQHDGWPADAHRPTNVLERGMLIRDVHYLSWIKPASPDELWLRIGLYESSTGEPMLLPDQQAFVLVPVEP